MSTTMNPAIPESSTITLEEAHTPRVPMVGTRGSRHVMQRIASSNNPVIVVAVAAAIVLGVGFIAYLTAQCIANGYRGFVAVVDINWDGAFSANVTTECFT